MQVLTFDVAEWSNVLVAGQKHMIKVGHRASVVLAGLPAGEVRRARRGGGAGRKGWPRRASGAAAGSTVPRHGAAAAAGPRSPPAHGWALAVTPLTPQSLHRAISHRIIPYIKFANGNSDSFLWICASIGNSITILAIHWYWHKFHVKFFLLWCLSKTYNWTRPQSLFGHLQNSFIFKACQLQI